MSQANPNSIEATLYAESYILDGCQTTAFRRAFPTSTTSQENAYTRASIVHKTPQVQARIVELQAISKKISEKQFGITASGLKETLAEVIKRGLKSKTDKDGNEIPVSLTAVVSAANEISKMDGNHAETRVKLLGEKEHPIPYTMEPAVFKACRKQMLEGVDV